MTPLLDHVAAFRLYADAIGLALLPLGLGLAGWFWIRAEMREARALKDRLRRLKP